MGEVQSMTKNSCVGLLAHVDAGKTTLSEGLLYAGGSIRKVGRVDRKDTFLDTDAMERARGITIFSKQAMIELPERTITLLDTPGHVDFSAEMERTLQVLDYAFLVISGADGVQGHTKTLWSLLRKYQIPVFLFINKMDQPGTDRENLLSHLKQQLSDGCVSFDPQDKEQFYEELATGEEAALEEYLDSGVISDETIIRMIERREVFPCYFGSALKQQGVEEFLRGFMQYSSIRRYPEAFRARVFKIAKDPSGKRLSYLKVTGGTLHVRDTITKQGKDPSDADSQWSEKVSQIRIYSGEKYTTAEEVPSGCICAITGLSKTAAGMGLGGEADGEAPGIVPVLTYQVMLTDGSDITAKIPFFRQLEEEEPELHIVWDEERRQLLVQVMGKVQIEILKNQLKTRFGIEAEFGQGRILYRETIRSVAEGVGHFEPLRHYAEVHLLLEPGEPGSGIVCDTDCSEDLLDKNWQRLILTHIMEREHKGVLTGSYITDIKITLKSGRAHKKHTEGGDFRQATYRAIRQGLKKAESVLLEPFYRYQLLVPERNVGRAMTDLEQMHATMELPEQSGDMSLLRGKAPVVCMQEYAADVAAYTGGEGRLLLSYGGYGVCHNPEEVLEKTGYDSERDIANPTGSVFCAHGAGFLVPWDEVESYMHLESCLAKPVTEPVRITQPAPKEEERWLGIEEVDAIIDRAGGANRRAYTASRKQYMSGRKKITADRDAQKASSYRGTEKHNGKEYLLVDGYNVIHAWKELQELSTVNMDSARDKLLDTLCDYQGIRGCEIIAVFDAYRVAGHPTEYFDYQNIHVVYTKEAETADAYIEKFAHEHGRTYRVTVATSDGLEQVIIRGQGCLLLSARELETEIYESRNRMLGEHSRQQEQQTPRLLDQMDQELAAQLKVLSESQE